MFKKTLLRTAIIVGILLSANNSFAEEDNKIKFNSFTDLSSWQVRLRAINVDPDEISDTSLGATTDIDVKSNRGGVSPELDFTYFLTKNIGFELILATANHSLYTNSGIDLGDAWILPPTLTAQYHFMPDETIRPYVGAGLNYTIFYDENKSSGLNRVEYQGGLGYALQAGADYMITENWGLNFDVKKLFLDVDASVNNGAISADVDLNPWIFGTGITYKF